MSAAELWGCVRQTELADQHYDDFCERCSDFFANLAAAIEYHERQLLDLQRQGLTVEEDREAYNMSQMILLLRKYDLKKKRGRKCVIS